MTIKCIPYVLIMLKHPIRAKRLNEGGGGGCVNIKTKIRVLGVNYTLKIILRVVCNNSFSYIYLLCYYCSRIFIFCVLVVFIFRSFICNLLANYF